MQSIKNNLKKVESAADAAKILLLNIMINDYGLENVVMGHALPNEKIPFDKYIRELELQYLEPYKLKQFLNGAIIDKNLNIHNLPMDFFYRLHFCNVFNYMLRNFPTYKKNLDVGTELVNFKHGLKDYIEGLYLIFCEIMDTQVTVDALDLFPQFSDKKMYSQYKENFFKFLVAVKTKGIRQGTTVDRYIKDLPIQNIFLQRIVKFQNRHYRLINNNISSIEFKLAFITSIPFMNQCNDRLFELKAEVWEMKRKKLVLEKNTYPYFP